MEIIQCFLTFVIPILTSATDHCIPLRNDKCSQELGSYNFTTFPNVLGLSDYTSANLEFQKFQTLIESSCSPSLLPFLCSAYFPKCDPQMTSVLPPCATECVKSMAECSFLFSFYGFQWPASLSCDKFDDGRHCPREYKKYLLRVYDRTMQNENLCWKVLLIFSSFVIYFGNIRFIPWLPVDQN